MSGDPAGGAFDAARAQLERVQRLYAHLDDAMTALGQDWNPLIIDYHPGARYATQAMSDVLATLGADASWRVADVCSGWGGPARHLAERFGCRVIGVDLTERSLPIARRMVAGSTAAPLVTFVRGDALDLPLASGSIDAAWSQDSFCYLPDRRRALAEVYRALRPGGHLLFTDWTRTEFLTKEELAAICAAQAFPDLETCDSYRGMLTAAGFDVVRAESVGREYVRELEALAVKLGFPTWIQRAASRDDAEIDRFVGAFGLQAHLDRLERDKGDVYVALGKIDIVRFVCRKP